MIYIFRKEMKKWHSVLWLVLVSLVVGGLSALLFRPKHPSEIGVVKVNGSEVNFKTYTQALSEIKAQIESYRVAARMYGIPVDMFLSMSGFNNPEKAAYDKCINSELIDQQLYNFKLEISPDFFEEELLKNLPAEIKDPSGNLNMEAYKFYTSRLYTNIPEFEQNREDDFKRDLFTQIIEQANYIPEKDLVESFAEKTIKKSFAILEFSNNKYLEQAKKNPPKEQDIVDFYKKNKEAYRIPEKRDAVYWQISPEKYSQKITIDEQAIQNFYNKNKSTLFRIPPKVKVRNILLKIDSATTPKQMDSILEKAKTIKKDLSKNADKFVDFVSLYSEDDKTKKNSGLIDFFEKGTYDKNFEKAAFRLLKSGEISDIVKTKNGYEIIQLVERISADYKPIDKVKDEIVKTIRTRKEQVVLRSALEKLIHEERTSKNAILDFAKNNKLVGKKTGLLVFANSVGKDLKDLISEKLFAVKRKEDVFGYLVYQKDYVIYKMTDIKDSYIPKFEDIKTDVLDNYYKSKVKQLIKTDIKKARSEFFAKKKEFNNLKDEFNLSLIESGSIKKGDAISGLDFGKELSSGAFMLNDSDQLFTYKNNSNSYLVRLVESDKVNIQDFQDDKIKLLEQEKDSSNKQFLSAFIASLLRSAKIENMQKIPNMNEKQ